MEHVQPQRYVQPFGFLASARIAGVVSSRPPTPRGAGIPNHPLFLDSP